MLPFGNQTWPRVATLGVLTVGVKARCSFKVVSGMGAKFDNLYSTKAPSSSVFERSRGTHARDLSRNPLLTLGLCQIALLLAQCDFCDCFRNPLVTLGLSQGSSQLELAESNLASLLPETTLRMNTMLSRLGSLLSCQLGATDDFGSFQPFPLESQLHTVGVSRRDNDDVRFNCPSGI